MATARPLFKVCLLLKKDRVIHYSCRKYIREITTIASTLLRLFTPRLPSGTGTDSFWLISVVTHYYRSRAHPIFFSPWGRWRPIRKKLECCYELRGHENVINRPISYSRYWSGTSFQLRLIRGVFSNANGIKLFLMKILCTSLHCKLVPVRYREYENGLFYERPMLRN